MAHTSSTQPSTPHCRTSRWRHALAAAGLLGALIAAGSARAACDKPAPIRFATGTSGADLGGSVLRGERDCYSLGARAGQRLAVTQTPGPDDNIVFQIYQPGWKITHDADGLDVAGAMLPGAGEEDDAAKWSGPLPANGTYLLVIGTSRGNGGYRLHVEIR
ncbi:MAG: hypothetical protein P4L71_18630 [Acetobacteraceae bacterium]|nr:hypothetical protein [Acetobacteraceae bacterium]